MASAWRDRPAVPHDNAFRTREEQREPGRVRIEVELEGFAAQALEQQSRSLEVTVEDLVGFSVLYYLADVDSGRIAREIAVRADDGQRQQMQTREPGFEWLATSGPHTTVRRRGACFGRR